jgi:hypothetical protein
MFNILPVSIKDLSFITKQFKSALKNLLFIIIFIIIIIMFHGSNQLPVTVCHISDIKYKTEV